MERYAPHVKDLASRDVVARAIATEVHEGRGCGARGDHVLLRVDHLGEEVVRRRPAGDPGPRPRVCWRRPGEGPHPGLSDPALHDGRDPDQPVRAGGGADPGPARRGDPGSLRRRRVRLRLGARRQPPGPGTRCSTSWSSGRAAGNQIIEFLVEHRRHRPLEPESVAQGLAAAGGAGRTPGRGERRRPAGGACAPRWSGTSGFFAPSPCCRRGCARSRDQGALPYAEVRDRSRVFNTARVEALELDNLVEVGIATVVSALGRRESRGAHSRVDYPQRDDVNWLKHSLYFRDGHRLEYKPVRLKPLTVDAFPPKERVY